MRPAPSTTGFQLKIAAIVAMTCNHVAAVFGPGFPAVLDLALYAVGGVTFPIMAFLLVEGFRHTSNLRNYALRLLAFALFAQVPYSLLFGAEGNVLFTLLVGLGILWVNERYNTGLGLLAVVVCTLLLYRFVDWGSLGFIAIYLFSISASAIDGEQAQGSRRADVLTIVAAMAVLYLNTGISALAAADVRALGYALVGYTIATVLLCWYRGRRGRPMKWFFYAYYPLHLFVIWLITLILP